jgi:hypothetical protein
MGWFQTFLHGGAKSRAGCGKAHGHSVFHEWLAAYRQRLEGVAQETRHDDAQSEIPKSRSQAE